MIPNIVKGSDFRGLANYLLVGRKNATVIGGNMAGRNALELTREFGICRRLRPGPKKPVMHHTLSFADGEDPGDEVLAVAAEKYIQRMGLESHQWVAVVHRDKAHVHAHLAINRVGLDGAWWNATHDFERSQIVAGQVEVEFGFVQVPRERLSYAIQKAVVDKKIHPPEVGSPPPLPSPGIKHVLGEIRVILESIPKGLSAPEWVQEVESRGLVAKPSIGGEKISGFTVRMPGHRAVKLSDVHRSLSWPKLLSSGRVLYDPEVHFEALVNRRYQESDNDPTTRPTPLFRTDSRRDERDLDPDGEFWIWDWQPIQRQMVGGQVGEGPWPDPGATSKIPVAGPTRVRAQEPTGSAPLTPGGPGTTDNQRSRVPSPGVWGNHAGTVQEVSFATDIELIPHAPARQSEHLLGGDSERGSEPGPDRDSRFHAREPVAGAEGSPGASETFGELAEPMGGGLPRGGRPSGTRDRGPDGSGNDLGWRGFHRNARELTGTQVDFEDLELPPTMIPPQIRRAATMVVAREADRRLPAPVLERHVLTRETLWEEAQLAELSAGQYRQAKATAQSVQRQLEPARAIIAALTLAAKEGRVFKVSETQPSNTSSGLPQKAGESDETPKQAGDLKKHKPRTP